MSKAEIVSAVDWLRSYPVQRLQRPGNVELNVVTVAHGTTDKPPVLLVTGWAETYERYAVLVKALSATRTVVAFDHREQGLSSHDKTIPAVCTHVTDAAVYVDDLLAVVDSLGDLPNGLTALAHSMGGLLSLMAEIARPGVFSAICMSAPMLCHKNGVFPWRPLDSAIASALASAVCGVGGGRLLAPPDSPVPRPRPRTGKGDSALSDPEAALWWADYKRTNPTTNISRQTFAWGRAMFRAEGGLARRYAEVTVPVLVLQADHGREQWVWNAAHDRLRDAMGPLKCRLLQMAGAQHEVPHELANPSVRAAVLRNVEAFLANAVDERRGEPFRGVDEEDARRRKGNCQWVPGDKWLTLPEPLVAVLVLAGAGWAVYKNFVASR